MFDINVKVERITELVNREQMKTVSCEDMIKRIEKYPVTNGMKLKGIYYIEWVSQEIWDHLLQI